MNDDEKTQGDFYILNPDGSSQYIGSSACFCGRSKYKQRGVHTAYGRRDTQHTCC